MRHILCNRCGGPVSNLVPDETVVQAWIVCPECAEKEKDVHYEVRQNARTGVWGIYVKPFNVVLAKFERYASPADVEAIAEALKC